MVHTASEIDHSFVMTVGEEAETWEKITDLQNENGTLKEKIISLNDQLGSRNSQEAVKFAGEF